MSIELEKAGLDRFHSVIKIAKPNPAFCKESEKIADAVKKILSTGHRRIPIITRKNEVVGILSLMDILNAFLRRQSMGDKVSTIMSRDVIFCNATDPMGLILQKFKFSRRGGFPILNKKKMVGMVSERDFVKYFSNVDFGIKVEELMTRKPFFVTPNITILDCLKSIANTRYRRLPVVKSSKLIGIETGTDILKYINENEFSFSSLAKPIESIMIKDVISISKEKDVSDAIKKMKTKDIGGLPVVDDKNNLEGFITERDILEEIV
jgi:CBS domain-containing protein